MKYTLKFSINEKIFLKDPESSDLGKAIIANGIELINEIGFEAFTFKKLAIYMDTTEASIYRYFESKHKLLLYIFSLYWLYLQYLIQYRIPEKNPKEKIIFILKMLTNNIEAMPGELAFNKDSLNNIVVSESSKTFLIKDVNEINKDKVFQPLKELCDDIAFIFLEYNPKYEYPHSLASTIIETSHNQQHFANHLPRLTDTSKLGKKDYTEMFLTDMVFRVLDR